MRILITTGGWKSALTCMRSFAKAGHDVYLITSDEFTPARFSKFCKGWYLSPEERDREGYIDFLVNLIRKNSFDILIPISDRCLEYVSELREQLSPYIRFLIPSKHCVEIARNKDKTYHFAVEHGISMPQTFFPRTLKEVEGIARRISFPCVVKEPKGTGGSGNSYPRNRKELLQVFLRYAERQLQWPFVQEYINGQFCGFTAVCNKGNALNPFMFQVLRQYPASGGVTVYARSMRDQAMFDQCTELIRALDWTGPIDLDLFVTDKGRFVLLEINPRFSGATQFAYRCGVDLPQSLLGVMDGNGNKPLQPKYQTGILYRSVFCEEIESCFDRPSYFFDFLKNSFQTRVKTDIDLADTQLFLWQLKSAKWCVSKRWASRAAAAN